MRTEVLLLAGVALGMGAAAAARFVQGELTDIDPSTGGVNLPDGATYGPAAPTDDTITEDLS